MDLAVAQRELGALLDTEAEKRESDFDSKLTDAKGVGPGGAQCGRSCGLGGARTPLNTGRITAGWRRTAGRCWIGANVGEMFDALIAHSVPVGQMAELQQHFNLQGNQVPLAMLETRAVTPAPGNVGQQQQAIIPWTCSRRAAAAFLGRGYAYCRRG